MLTDKYIKIDNWPTKHLNDLPKSPRK